MSHLKHGFRHIAVPLCLALFGVGQTGCRSWIRPGTDVPQSLDTMPPFYRGSAVLLPGADYHLAIVRTGPSIVAIRWLGAWPPGCPMRGAEPGLGDRVRN